MKSNVLRTRLLDSHTADDLAKGLTEAVEDWKLVRPNVTIPVTTDNVRNIVNAVTAAGLEPQIGCFAHTKHRSTTGNNVLKRKLQLLQLSENKLIQDVPTRWNSSHDMMERYLQQQSAVYSAMTDGTVKKSMKNIQCLSQDDLKLAEYLLKVMKALKTVTIMMCEASSPTTLWHSPMMTAQQWEMSKKPSGMTWSRDPQILAFRITYTGAPLWFHDSSPCETWMMPLTREPMEHSPQRLGWTLNKSFINWRNLIFLVYEL